MTSETVEKRTPTLIAQLAFRTQSSSSALLLSVWASDFVFDKVIAKVDKQFGFDSSTLLHSNVSAFFCYVCENTMNWKTIL